MVTKIAMGAAIGLLLAVCPALAQAADEGRGISGPEAVRILQDAGFRAKLDKDEQGDPMVETRMSGVNVYLHFYDCDKQSRCGSLQFLVGLDLEDGTTADTLNAFNREYRYVRTYLDDERDPFLAYDVEVLHAQHAAHLTSQINLWEELLDAFLRATGYGDDGNDDADDEAAKPVKAALQA